MKLKEFEKHLAKCGCNLLREGSNHSIWINPENKKQSSVIRHNEIDNRLCKNICKQLDIPSI